MLAVVALRDEQRELTRRKVLSAVLDLVADGSLDELSVPAVARKSGVSLATIYRYFPTKDALIAAAASEPERTALHAEPATDYAEYLRSMWHEFSKNLPLLRHQATSAAGREMREARLDRSKKLLSHTLKRAGIDPKSAGGRAPHLRAAPCQRIARARRAARPPRPRRRYLRRHVALGCQRTHGGNEAMTTTALATTFEAPGPGAWRQLADHFPGALTAEYQRIYAETCPPAMAAYMKRYGVIAKTLDVGFVHGYLYIAPRIVGAPKKITRTPPTALLRLAARLHPEMRRRNKAAGWALAERPWRAVAARWFEVERHDWYAEDAAVQAIDPSGLTRDELIDHLRACCRAGRAWISPAPRAPRRRHASVRPPPRGIRGVGHRRRHRRSRSRRRVTLSAGTVAPEDWQLITGYDLDGRAWIELGRSPEQRATAPSLEPLDLHPLVPEADHDELDALVADARVQRSRCATTTASSPRRGLWDSCAAQCSKPDAGSSCPSRSSRSR